MAEDKTQTPPAGPSADEVKAAEEAAAKAAAEAEAKAQAEAEEKARQEAEAAAQAAAEVLCAEHFPLGFPEGVAAVGCEHGTWQV